MTTIDDQAAPIAIPIRPDETKAERNERLRLLARSPTFLLGSILVGVWIVCAILGNLIAPHDPVAPDILSKFEGPSGAHLFGTDKLGQDVLSRVIVGARSILVVAPLATILGTVLGTTIGLVTGYYRGFVDEATMRVVDAVLAIPLIITALLAVTAVGPSRKTLVLVIGFGLHNATEGFGIVGPLGGVRPSWRWLGLVGLIGGGPTFLGTLVGFQVHSDALELMFYALAGGAILYVIGEIWTGMRRYGHRTLGLYMIAGGFLLGVATDLVVSYGGG